MKRPIIPFTRLIALLCDTMDKVIVNGDFNDGLALIQGVYASLCEFRTTYRAKLENECEPLSEDDLPF